MLAVSAAFGNPACARSFCVSICYDFGSIDDFNQTNVIGLPGSYGSTFCKKILYTMLLHTKPYYYTKTFKKYEPSEPSEPK